MIWIKKYPESKMIRRIILVVQKKKCYKPHFGKWEIVNEETIRIYSEKEEAETMMQTLKIDIYKPQKKEPDTKITIPLSSLSISEKLLPSKVKASLEREGIDLSELSVLFAKQGPKGTLIEVENLTERIVIAIE